jgi:hypothetical protein
MQKRAFFNLCLLASILVVREIWDLYRDQHYDVNPWIALNYPYSIQWFLKDLGRDVGDILAAIIIYRNSRMQRVYRIGATVFLFFMCLELILFFLNFNQTSYLPIYASLFLVTMAVAYFHYYRPETWIYTKMSRFVKWFKATLMKINIFAKSK